VIQGGKRVFGFKLVHRTILAELVKVFTLTLIALTSLLLLAGLVAEASQHGMTPSQILGVIPLLLPNMLPYTLPTTTLFATCIVYGRLAADNEILAIKAAGVHVFHVVWPAVLLGLVSSAVTAALYYEVIPSTHHELRTQIFNDIQSYFYSILRKEGQLKHPKIDYEIHVKQVDGDILRDAIFKRLDPKTKTINVVATAKEAKLRVDREKRLLWVDMRNGEFAGEGGGQGRLEERSWPVELSSEFEAPRKLRPTDMTWQELDLTLADISKTAAAAQQEIAVTLAEINQSGSRPQQKLLHVENLRNQLKTLDGIIVAIHAEKQMRPAIAVGCLCFVLVGCPVGIWFSKSDYLSAFITCFLPIIVMYYPLLLSSINVAKGLKLTPLVIWSANGLMLLIGLGLFRRLARH
jgi:lipopolysaccharide export system permease protein